MRVMVTGGRFYGSKQTEDGRYMVADHAARLFLSQELDHLHATRPISVLIVGDAAGVDLLAFRWANECDVRVERFRADWKKLKRGAGPERNGRMIREGRPDMVIAFEGGTGTANAVDQARKAGIEVIELRSKS